MHELTERIAAELGEEHQAPIMTIERLVTTLGEERALALLEETLAIEAEGGLLTAKKKRRRTPGGAFVCRVTA